MHFRARPLLLALPLFACRETEAPRAHTGEPSPPSQVVDQEAPSALPAAKVAIPDEPASPHPSAQRHVSAQGQLGPGPGALFVGIEPPKGAKLTLDAPLRLRASGGIGLEFPEELRGPLGSHELPLRVPLRAEDGATGPAQIDLSYYWCTEGNEAACRQEKVHLEVQLDITGDAPGGEAHIVYEPET